MRASNMYLNIGHAWLKFCPDDFIRACACERARGVHTADPIIKRTAEDHALAHAFDAFSRATLSHALAMVVQWHDNIWRDSMRRGE